MMKCPNCNVENESRVFCKNCDMNLYQNNQEENNNINEEEEFEEKKTSSGTTISLIIGIIQLLIILIGFGGIENGSYIISIIYICTIGIPLYFISLTCAIGAFIDCKNWLALGSIILNLLPLLLLIFLL